MIKINVFFLIAALCCTGAFAMNKHYNGTWELWLDKDLKIVKMLNFGLEPEAKINDGYGDNMAHDDVINDWVFKLLNAGTTYEFNELIHMVQESGPQSFDYYNGNKKILSGQMSLCKDRTDQDPMYHLTIQKI